MAKIDNTGSLTLGTSFLASLSTIATATFVVDSIKITITLKNLGYSMVATSTKIYTYFPCAIKVLNQTPLNFETYFYFTKEGTSEKQVLYQNIWDYWGVNSGVYQFDSIASTGASQTSGSSWSVGASSGVTITQSLNKASGWDVHNGWFIGLSLPAGYTFSRAPQLLSKIDAAATYTAAPISLYIASQSEISLGGFIIGYGTSDTPWGAATSLIGYAVTYNLQAANLQPPNYAVESGSNNFGVWIADPANFGDICKYSAFYTSTTSTVEISPLNLDTPTCTSNSGAIIGLSADSVNLSMTFGFTTTIKVLSGGSVVFTMDSSWTWPILSSSYSSTSMKAVFSLSGSVLYVTMIDDLEPGTYNVVTTGVLPPMNTEINNSIEKDCFTALSTQSAYGKTIESWSRSAGPLQTTINSSALVTIGTSSSAI